MPRKNPEYNSYGKTEERTGKLRVVLEKRQPTLTVVAENISDPHNLSAMVRSCDAVGVFEICLVYTGKQQFPKLGEKSSASARKWVNMRKYDSIKKCYEDLRVERKKIYTTHMAKEAISLYELNLVQPVALVFGNEHDGISNEAAETADGNFLIPQVGIIQSLNISVACAVSLYEAFRQRQLAGVYSKNQFSESDFKVHFDNWLKK